MFRFYLWHGCIAVALLASVAWLVRASSGNWSVLGLAAVCSTMILCGSLVDASRTGRGTSAAIVRSIGWSASFLAVGLFLLFVGWMMRI